MKLKRSQVISISVGAVVVVAGLAALTYHAAQTPQRVFSDMLSNNLATSGVTRVVQQSGSGLSISQYTQLNLGTQPTAHALTIFKQNGGTIATEEISTPNSDYVRYKNIVATKKNAAGKPIDTSNVVGKWAQLKANDTLTSTVTSGLFDQSLLGILPIANLNAANRDQLLAYMKQDNVYSFDASKVKTITQNGRKQYQYAVSIKPSAYISLMQQFGKLVGANQYNSLDPQDYVTTAAIPATVTVDVRSHQLTELQQASSGRVEIYKAFGLASATPIPHATLTTSELEKRITSLQ